MFVPYALAAGMALALVGLYCEVALHLGWSRRRKGWGGLIVAAATMGVVPAISTEAGQIAVATACGSIVLVLSVRGHSHQVLAAAPAGEPCATAESQQHLYIDTATAASFIAPASSPAPHSSHQTDEPASITPLEPTPVEPLIEEEEPVLEAEELVLEEEGPVLEAEELVLEEEGPVLEEEPVLEAEGPVLVVEEELVLEEQPQVTAEWLNEQIARAYEAKASGKWQAALVLFEQAVRHCTDPELNSMFQEEIAQLRSQINPDILQAS